MAAGFGEHAASGNQVQASVVDKLVAGVHYPRSYRTEIATVFEVNYMEDSKAISCGSPHWTCFELSRHRKRPVRTVPIAC